MPSKIPLSILVTLGLALIPAVPASAGEDPWIPLGPAPGFTRTEPLFTHPAAPGSLWIGGYKSIDRGSSWRWAGTPLPTYPSATAADPSAPGAMWAATPAALLHTRGDGAPWKTVASPSYASALGSEEPSSLRAVREAPGALYVTTYRRLLASFGNGVDWRVLFDGGEALRVLEVIPARPAILYLLVVDTQGDFLSYHLLKTPDRGRTWTTLPCPANAAEGCTIGQVMVSRGAVFVSTSGSDDGLLRSDDGGRSWHWVLGPGENTEGISLLADPQTPGTLWALSLSGALWVSRDNGGSWTPLAKTPVQRLAAAGPGVLYAFGPAGIARSADGGKTWRDVFPVLRDPDRPPGRISFQPGHPSRLAFVFAHELFRSNDGGATWWWVSRAPSGINDALIDPVDPDRMYAAGVYGGWITTDGGRTWSASGSPGYAELLARGTGKTLYAGGCGVARSRDGGKTWLQVLSCSSPRDRRAGQYVQKLTVDPAHPRTVYALTFLDREFYPNHGPMNSLPSILWRSRDEGRSWEKLALDLDAFALDSESSRLWIVRGGEIRASDDGGASWRLMARVPEEEKEWVTDIAVPPGLPGTLYVSGARSLLRTGDNGGTWESLAPPAGLLAVWPTDPRTVVAMAHGGIHRLRLPE